MEENNVLTYLKVMNGEGKGLLCILSESQEGKRIQILFDGYSGFLADEGQVRFSKKEVFFDIREDGLEIHGRLYFSHHHGMKKDAMSYCRHLPLKMKYTLDASYMRVDGVLYVNGGQWIFDDGYGGYGYSYGEDASREYLSLSMIGREESAYLIVSDLRFGLIPFRYVSCQIQTKTAEYSFLHAEMVHQKRKHLVLKKGNYVVNIHLRDADELERKTLHDGKMERVVSLSLTCHADLVLTKKNEEILSLSSDEATYGYHFDK